MTKKPDWIAKAKRIMAEGDMAVAKGEASLAAMKRDYYTRLADVFIAAQKTDLNLTARMIGRAVGIAHTTVTTIIRWRAGNAGARLTPPFSTPKGNAYRSHTRMMLRDDLEFVVTEAAKLPPAKQRSFTAALRRAGVQEPEDAPVTSYSRHLSPSRSGCDLNHEAGEHLTHKHVGGGKMVVDKNAGVTKAKLRRGGAGWQIEEAIRLAEGYRLLEPEAKPSEVTKEDVVQVKRVVDAWTATLKELKRRLRTSP